MIKRTVRDVNPFNLLPVGRVPCVIRQRLAQTAVRSGCISQGEGVVAILRAVEIESHG